MNSIRKIKDDLDKKYRELKRARNRRSDMHENLMRNYKKLGISAVREAEHKISMLDNEIRNLEKERDAIELDAYGVWIPRARAVRAGNDVEPAGSDEDSSTSNGE